MARKAVQGYTEKNYYDNTRYRGITATTDPLNEGFFKHMVNLEISDTGQSLKPRKGYLTTTISGDDGIISLSDKTIIFKDNSTQKYIVFDILEWRAYLVDISHYNVKEQLIPIESSVNITIDASDLVSIHPDLTDEDFLFTVNEDTTVTKPNASYNMSIYSNTVETLVDMDMVTKAVIKMSYTIPDEPEVIFWLELYYRHNAVIGNGTQEAPEYPANTLVLSYINLDEQPSVYTFERNLASKESIIPETMQVVYDSGDTPERFVNQFPIMYAKTNDNKYLLNMCNDYKMKVIPHFQLEKSSDPNIHWYYTYDIIENSVSTNKNDDAKIYRAPIYTVSDNIRVHTHIGLDAAVESATKDYELLKNIPIITIIPKEPAKLSVDGVTVTELTDDSTVYDNPTENVTQGRTFAFRFVNTYPKAILPTVDAGELIGALNKRIYDIRNKLTTVQTRGELINVLLSIPDDYLYYVKTFDETYDDYDIRYGSLFKRSCLYGDQYLSNVKTGYLEGSFFGNTYGIGALNKDEIISYINKSPVSEFFFRFYPTAFVFRYLSKHSANSPYIFPTTYLSSYTDFYIYCGFAAYSDYTALKDLLKTKNTYKATVINAEHITEETDESLFQYDNNLLVADFNNIDTGGFKKLYDSGYFTNGIHIVFYLFQAQNQSTSDEEFHVLFSRLQHVSATAFLQNFFIQKTNRPVTYIEEYITKEPLHIVKSDQYTVFKENMGDRLVVWKDNHVYVSEPGAYYYFKEDMHKQYNERVVKVIQFKTVLLVFTVQHLYAIYPVEITSQVNDPNSESGKSTTTTVVYYTTPVLYNILTSDKYKDAIQVFNQMVLFYSADGQMFMIKPSATIDSDTRFSLQYFNKSANDILLNYTDYINDRLKVYGVDRVVEASEVKIKVLISINYIKTFYTVEGLITYVLIYDVLNNYYYVQDTLSFYNLKNLMYVEGGEVYTTVVNDKLYLTFPFAEQNAVDNNVDSSFLDNFSEQPIHAEIDTGILNLNNHLWKRFRDLYVTYKNLNATKLEFMLDIFLDDVVVQTYLNTVLEVRDIGGQQTFINTVDKNKVELVNNEHALFDFSDYQSNKLLTHKGQILGLGKAFRMKMHFVSKGNYKIQDFGIVYKERRV